MTNLRFFLSSTALAGGSSDVGNKLVAGEGVLGIKYDLEFLKYDLLGKSWLFRADMLRLLQRKLPLMQ